MKKAPFTNLTASAVEKAAIYPGRSEPLLEWIVSQLTTQSGVPMPVGYDTSAGIVERIRRHSNNAVSGAAEPSGYVCTMDADCMPECCAQWRRGGGCANTGGDCKFRKPNNGVVGG